MIALARHLPGAPADMIALIEAWDSVRPQLEALAGAAPDHKLTDVTLHAPLTRPDKIMGIGLNYADHAAEAKTALPGEQIWYSKQGTCTENGEGPWWERGGQDDEISVRHVYYKEKNKKKIV